MSEGYLPPVVVTCIGDAKDFMQTVAEVKAALRDLEDKKAEPTIAANLGPLETGVAEAAAELEAIGNMVVEPTIKPKISMPWGTYTAISAAMGSLGTNPIRGVATPWSQGKGPGAIDAALSTFASDSALAALSRTSTNWKQYSAINSALAGWAASGGGGGSAARQGFLAGLVGRVFGGGGSSGNVWRGLGMGTSGIPFLGGMAGMGTLAGLMGFGAEHVLTTGLGVAGSAGAGLLGGGLLGLGSLGVMGVGMGTDMAGIGQAAGDIKSVVQAQNNLSDAMAVYGVNSRQAVIAQRQLNNTLAGFSPVARQAVAQAANAVQGFKDMFDKLTGPAEKIGAQIITSGIGVGEAFLPTIGKYAATNMGIIQGSLTGKGGLFPWMQSSSGGLGIFTDLEKEFTRNLPTAMHAFTQFFELFAKTIDTASHYTGGFIVTLDRFFTKWNGAGWSTWQAEIGKLIGDFRVWWAFLKQIGVTIYDVFKPAAGAGQALIVILTQLLKQFDTWLTGAGKSTLGGLFGAHNAEIKAMGGILKQLLPVLEQALGAFLKLSTNGTQVFTTLLKAVTPFIAAIGSSKVGSVLLGWAATLALVHSRLGAVMNLGGGLKGTLGRGLGIAGYGAVGGLMAGQALGLHGSAATALTVGGASLGLLPLIGPAVAAIKQLPSYLAGLVGILQVAGRGFGQLAASMVRFVASFVAGAARAIAAGAVWIAEHAVQVAMFVAQNLVMVASATAAFIAENAATLGIIAGIMLLVAGIVYLATHWSQVWNDIKHWFDDAVKFLRSGFGTLVILLTGPLAPLLLLALHWQQVWTDIKHWFNDAVNFLRSGFGTFVIMLTGPIAPLLLLALHWGQVWHGIEAVVQGVWSVLSGIFNDIIGGVRDVVNAIDSVHNAVSHVPGAGLLSHVPVVGSLFQHASGTAFAPGGWSWVGEHGPELMHVSRGAQIYPHEQSKRMAGGTGGNTYYQTFELPPTDNPHGYANEVGWAMGTRLAGIGVK